jgi:hypothetical protein
MDAMKSMANVLRASRFMGRLQIDQLLLRSFASLSQRPLAFAFD